MRDSMSKMELKRQIAAAHFMLEDLQLYLNTHPTDREALAKRNSYAKQLRMLKEEYDKCFDMMDQDDSLSTYPWEWIQEPWPWEYEANYKL
ncbi:spore coat protein CotJB [Clostridium swellfunianum]|uniref:spore coat protein CotJB n=1 Tax=Clostridium swellfunianum TaxID=1367462 RepID=UPI002030E77D|nr:spore coat protein CotJB [Clostridium swellfunianum]MCM0649826.1 spore coat protein CotJB [Clostridium swellfunianum]